MTISSGLSSLFFKIARFLAGAIRPWLVPPTSVVSRQRVEMIDSGLVDETQRRKRVQENSRNVGDLRAE
jgi:hypothetical protein